MLHNIRQDDDIPRIALTISNRTLMRVVIVVIVTLALIAAFFKITHALLLVFFAFFLALALNAPITKIGSLIPGKRRNNRSAATAVSFIIIILFFGAFAAYIIPPIVNQTEKFITAAPSLIFSSTQQHSSLGHFIRSHHLQNEVNILSRQMSQRLKGASGNAFSSITSIANSIFSMLAVLVLTFMMLVEGPNILLVGKDMFVPNKHSLRIEKISSDMYAVIKGYVNGQALLAFIAAVLIAPALFMLHVSYPIALMVVVFLAGLIPMIGHTIGAIIITVVALFHSFTAAIIILLYYILYMQIENYLLQPRIQANSTNMSPLLVFSSLIIGVDFGGLFGGLVAIPVAACIKVIVLEYLSSKEMLPEKYVNEELASTDSER